MEDDVREADFDTVAALLQQHGAHIGGVVSDAAVAEAEGRLGSRFHPALREYLQRFGWIDVEDLELFGLGEGVPPFLDIVRVTESERVEADPPLPRTLAPVWNDCSGSLYCVVSAPESDRYGSIVVWDPALGPDQEPEEYGSDLVSWILAQLRAL